MDKKTFDELFEADELSLILMDGGADLTKEQMAKVKARAEEQKQEKLQEMAMELAGTPGYMEFMTLPLISKMMGDAFKKPSKEKPKQEKEQKADTSVKEESKEKPVGKKDPQLNTIAPTAETKLKPGDSEGDILGKIFNLMVKSYHERDDEFKEKTKYNEMMAEKKEERSKELIGLFSGKQKKQPKKQPEKKKEKPKQKEEEKKESGKTAEPASRETPKTTAKETPKPTAKETPKPTAEPVPKTPPATGSTAVKVAGGVAAAELATTALAKIKKNEAFSEQAYHDPKKDSNGKIVQDAYSVGYGHQITQQEIKNGYILVGDKKIPVLGPLGKDTKISKDDADKLAKQEYQKYEDSARTITNFDKLNAGAQFALIDMTYNMGVGWYSPKKWPKLYNALSNLDMEAVAKSVRDSKYYKDTGRRAEENAELLRNGLNKQNNVQPQTIPSPDTGNKLDNSSRENKSLKSSSMNSKSPSVAMLATTTNIIKGSPTYSISEENSSDYPALLQKQYNLN